ncbi:thioredoxin domain-containing protein [Candidatus Gracilibacteria bacterium]|nr:thioredoxin domain-containing protein [Candidatus Gracilibacteria bacterium]
MVTKSTVQHDTGVAASTTTTSLQGLTIIMLASTLILNFVAIYLLMGFSFPMKFLPEQITQDSSMGIKRALLELEYEKVGGKETYDILQKYSQMQIAQNIDNFRNAVNGQDVAAPGAAEPSPTAADPLKDISQDEIKAIVGTASIEGNKDATIIAVEYSDMECPFCIRQYHSTKLFPNLLSEYGDKIGVAFKNNRGVNHPGTEAKAIGALCAKKLGGDGAYQKFYKGIMDKSTNEGGVMPVTELANLAKTLGLDAAKWQECYDKKETLAQFSSETQEAQKYGLGGTPGTMIINVKTGKYATVEGAYPYEKFVANINALSK